MGKTWTELELDFLRENYATVDTKELALIFDRTHNGVQLKAERIGLQRNVFHWNTESFQEFLNDNFNKEYVILSDFIAVGKEIKIRHNVCENTWVTKPAHFIYGKNRCPFCSITRNLEDSEFRKRVKEKSPNIIILERYRNQVTKIKVKCFDCEYGWIARPDALMKIKNYCPQCNNFKLRSVEEFKKDIYLANSNVELLDSPKTGKGKILIKCKVDGYEWLASPYGLINGIGCPRCGGVSKPSSEEFKNKMVDINSDVKILGEYINHYTKIGVRCLVDGNIWSAAPHTLLNGVGCPICSSISKGEKYCAKILYEDDISFSSQYSFPELISDYGIPLRFDFSVFCDNNIFCLIEIDGLGHFQPIRFNGMSEKEAQEKLNLIKHHDKLKDEYCFKNNIKLIRINYNGKNFREIKNILKKDILDYFLERR